MTGTDPPIRGHFGATTSVQTRLIVSEATNRIWPNDAGLRPSGGRDDPVGPDLQAGVTGSISVRSILFYAKTLLAICDLALSKPGAQPRVGWRVLAACLIPLEQTMSGFGVLSGCRAGATLAVSSKGGSARDG